MENKNKEQKIMQKKNKYICKTNRTHKNIIIKKQEVKK